MKKLLLILFAGLMFSCSDNFENINPVKDNVENVFGVTFSPNQDWVSAESGTTTLKGLDATKVQILGLVDEKLKVLNEADYRDGMTLQYDAPKGATLFLMTKNDKNEQTFSLLDESIKTRAITRSVLTPSNDPMITGEVIPYAVQRNYEGFSGEMLYTTNLEAIPVPGFTTSFNTILRAITFTYLPNGRPFNNLAKVKASGYYNEDCYAITTGEEPIVLSPVYKNDGGYHEVETCDLYYYYFKGDLTVDEIKALPKYKALSVNENMLADDELLKHHSYVLAYFGDGAVPTEVGSYEFPEGYKIGFMLRSNFNKDVKKGELFFDGRLNNNINKHGHFASSGLGDGDPRMCWISANKQMFFCCEAGTDADFNDIVVQVEGGVEPIEVPVIPEFNSYIFLFEDRDLGDYDMNDVVVKGTRIDETHVEYEVLATGAHDELYIKGIKGNIIKEDKEIHSYFNVPQKTFVNVEGEMTYPTVKETIKVNSKFSFLSNPISIFNKTTNKTIKIAQKGEDPHAIMVPYEFKWPLERICIKDAYYKFNEWGQNPVVSTDWYLYYYDDKVNQ